MTRLWRIAILSLSKAVRESRVKADQAERFGPFLHLSLHILASSHPMYGFNLLSKDDVGQVQQLADHACVRGVQSIKPLP